MNFNLIDFIGIMLGLFLIFPIWLYVCISVMTVAFYKTKTAYDVAFQKAMVDRLLAKYKETLDERESSQKTT